MADDRMRNDDRDRNVGASKQNQGNYGQGGQQSPGRNKQDDEFSTGHRGTDQQSQQGEQKHMKDDFGTSEKPGAGQGRQGDQDY